MVNMKTQDLMYLVTAQQTERKVRQTTVHTWHAPLNGKAFCGVQKIERLQGGLHCLEPTLRPNKHTVFVDTFDQASTFRPEEYFNTLPALLDRNFNRPTREQLQSEVSVCSDLQRC